MDYYDIRYPSSRMLVNIRGGYGLIAPEDYLKQRRARQDARNAARADRRAAEAAQAAQAAEAAQATSDSDIDTTINESPS